METLTGDRVIINVVTLVAASMVEEIRLAIMALHFSGGGSRCRIMEIGVHSRRRGHVGGRGHSWRCTWQQFLGVTYGRENEKKNKPEGVRYTWICAPEEHRRRSRVGGLGEHATLSKRWITLLGARSLSPPKIEFPNLPAFSA